MIITDMKVRGAKVNLKRPKYFAAKHITHRDYIIVNLSTDEGVDGWGFVSALPLTRYAVEMLRDLVIGQDVYKMQLIEDKMRRVFERHARNGIGPRAIAPIDMAFWDIIGKAANLPIYKLLGYYREEVPSYYSGGYYLEDIKTEPEMMAYLEKEIGTFKDQGFKAFKIKIGCGSRDFDLERIKKVREIIGPDSKLMLDAGCGYNADEIIAMARRFEQYDIEWLEEPVPPDDLINCAYVASRVSMPVAIGESHFSKHAIRDVLEYKAARILQADMTFLGGLSEFLHILGVCSTYGIRLSPHAFHDYTVQIGMARKESEIIEYLDASTDGGVHQYLFKNPVHHAKGMLRAPDGPGHGLILDEEALKHFEV